MTTAVRAASRPAPADQEQRGRDPSWDWRYAPARGDTDAVTARAALEQRIAWRLAHPDAWREGLARLAYFDPAYTYDEGHEYEWDWTTDPHIGTDVRHKILDEDGFVSPEHYRHGDLLTFMLRAFRALFGNRVEREPEVHFARASAARAGMRTDGGNLSTQVEPDLVVLPRELLLPEGVERNDEGRTMRLDEGHPVPELAIEILSPSTRSKDLREKLVLYADLGIAEYLTVDPGGKPEPDSPARMQFYRLQPDGRYRQDEPADAYFSAVCDTHLRLWQPDPTQPPRFQWWDADRDRWRDPETDAELNAHELQEARNKLRETRAASLAEGEARAIIRTLRTLLDDVLPASDLDRVADAWRRDGPPADAGQRIRAVLAAPRDWSSLLPANAQDNRGPDRPPPPREPRPPGGW